MHYAPPLPYNELPQWKGLLSLVYLHMLALRRMKKYVPQRSINAPFFLRYIELVADPPHANSTADTDTQLLSDKGDTLAT